MLAYDLSILILPHTPGQSWRARSRPGPSGRPAGTPWWRHKLLIVLCCCTCWLCVFNALFVSLRVDGDTWKSRTASELGQSRSDLREACSPNPLTPASGCWKHSVRVNFFVVMFMLLVCLCVICVCCLPCQGELLHGCLLATYGRVPLSRGAHVPRLFTPRRRRPGWGTGVMGGVGHLFNGLFSLYVWFHASMF